MSQRFKLRGAPFAMTALALAIAGLPLQAAETDAGAAKVYTIPAGTLSQALTNFADQAGIKLIFNPELTRNLSAAPLQGPVTVEQGLRELLKGSGLGFRKTNKSTFVIETRPTSVAEQPQSATTLPSVRVVGQAVYDSTDPYNPDYRLPNASTATKTDTPIMETPYSIAVVPKQVLEDQRFIRVEDSIRNVAGVTSSYANGGDSDYFMMRGFENLNLYRDGFLLPSALGGGTLKRQTANLERVEVLKGPGSLLFGRNEPGGVINLVTKRPQATPYHSVEQQFGSFDFYRTLVDSTGAITHDDTLLYRVNLSYENANSFRDFVKTDTIFLAPSFTWNISSRTQVNLDIEYQHFDNTNDSGIPPIGNRPAPVPRSRQIGDPSNNKTVGDRTYVGASWSHEFNDNWKINHRFGVEFLDWDTDFTFFIDAASADGNLKNLDENFGNGGVRGFNNGVGVSQQNYYTTLNLTGKFNTAMLEHSTLWGFDYFVIDNQQAGSECCAALPIGANFNIFNPTYLTSAPNLAANPGPDISQEWYGLYWQDQIKFPFNVYGNVGVRYDNANGVNKATDLTTTDDDHFSPRGGLLWKPLNWLAVYGNYTENFGPSNSLFRSVDQQALQPRTGEEWEMGAKTEFFDGRLSASFAYFELTQKNMSVPDPVNPNISIAIGEQESRGYEFETAGEILPGWRVIGAYTHIPFANVIKDVGFDGGPGTTGNRMFNTPHNFGSLWSTYAFQDGDLQGLKLGAGVNAASQSQGTNANTFQLPGYATLNLMASYGLKMGKSHVTLQLNANNLLDKTYYQGTNSGNMIGVGSPRYFLGSVKVEF